MLETDLGDRYEDPLVVAETGGGYGDYVCSYRYQGGLVEVRLFPKPDGSWVAFLSKAPGMPMDDAQAFADAAYHHEARRAGRVGIVMDPYSLPRTGSF